MIKHCDKLPYGWLNSSKVINGLKSVSVSGSQCNKYEFQISRFSGSNLASLKLGNVYIFVQLILAQKSAAQKSQHCQSRDIDHNSVSSHPLHVPGPVDGVDSVVVAGAAVAVDVAGEGEAPRPAVGQLVLARVARHLLYS